MSKYVQRFRIKNDIIYDTTTHTRIGLEGQRVKNRSNKDNFLKRISQEGQSHSFLKKKYFWVQIAREGQSSSNTMSYIVIPILLYRFMCMNRRGLPTKKLR